MRAKSFVLTLLLVLFIAACGSQADYDETQYTPDPTPEAAEAEPVMYQDEDYGGSLPILRIETYYDPFTQERTFWHYGTIALTGACDERDFEDVNIRVRGRGNSTWWRGMGKRPLRFRFREARPVLSENTGRDWILLANHFDRSLLRNYAALTLGNKLDGLSFTPVPHHVQLYVNGEYMGVYLLTDERNTEPGRLNITWDEDPAESGFFLELDARAYQTGILNETYIIVSGLYYDLRYPDDLLPEHVEYVRAYLEVVSYAIRRQSFDELLTLIDLDSFVDFYIVQEFFKDIDARDLSTFMYISGSGENRRLFMGPIWDFDLAAGNAANQPLGYGPEGLYVAEFNYWFRNLMRRPEFFEAVQTRWNGIRHNEFAETLEHVRHVATYYQNEFERNFIRHPNAFRRAFMPTPREILEIDYFMGHVEHLLNWMETRANWFDEFLNGDMAFYDHLTTYVERRQYNIININANGNLLEFNLPPVVFHHRIMVPVSELAGIISAMHNTSVAVNYFDGDLVVEFDSERFEFSIPTALPVFDDIFVPVRVIADIFGYVTSWDSTTNTVYLIS